MDKEFININKDILDNKEFNKLNNITHHGITRFDHSLRVSYLTYKVTKKLGLNYIDATRAALLHDFFTDEVINENSIFRLRRHPKYALENSKKYFNINLMMEDIIVKHMFPVTFCPPRYLESWIVDIIDDISAIYEKCLVYQRQLTAAMTFLFIMVYIRLSY